MNNEKNTDFGALYVVATPIGNLSDMTPRAVESLQSVAVIACEDTRTSGKLLNSFNVTTKTWAYHDHNADTQTDHLIKLLKQGQSVALISDAGTPLISDPGFRLVRACHDNAIKVIPIVGASAAIGALSVAGLASDKFYFYGFLPAKTTARQSQLQLLKNQPATLIFYEAPHRIIDSLSDILAVLGNRKIAFCRELTKTFETVRLCEVADLIDFIKNDSNQQKGEMVLIVAGFEDTGDAEDEHDKLLIRLMQDLSLKKAVALAADLTGGKKNTLYDRALLLSKK